MHEILVFIAYAVMPVVNTHADISSECLHFGLGFHLRTLCRQAGKALASLRIFADSPESLLLANATSIEISCTGPYIY